MNGVPINRKLRDSVKDLISVSKKLELAKTFSFEKYDMKKILKKEQSLPENLLNFASKILNHVFKYNFQIISKEDGYVIGLLSEAGRDRLNLSKELLIKCVENLEAQKMSSLYRFNKNNFSISDEFRLLAYLSIIYKIDLNLELFDFYKNMAYKLGKVDGYDLDATFNKIEKINIVSDNELYIPVVKGLIL
ncbi:hypothetical protein V4762_05340 [Thermodesulfobium sp. 4217-1]|uniref:hypothetical protein n=1 Tax=Thermodesulfobium sp. 4217-1 TaxID=3120013 RepID=UPI003221B8E8